MKIHNLDIEATINRAQKLIIEDQQMSETIESMIDISILVFALLANRLGLNSTNNSKAPSSDSNRKNRKKAARAIRLAGNKAM